MLFRSGRIENKMSNNRLIEPAQKNLNFEEARRLPNPEVNLRNVTVRQLVSRSNTRIIPRIISHCAGRGRGFIRINPKTLQKRCKITNENRKRVLNNPNLSLLWDGIDLPVPDLSKSNNPHLEEEVTSNGTFQVDSFLDENNQFLLEKDELI